MLNLDQGTTQQLMFYVKGNLTGTVHYLLKFANKATQAVVYAVTTNAADATCPFLLLPITEVGRTGMVDAVNGKIKLTPSGSWTVTVYEQASTTNLDPAAATVVTVEEINVIRNLDTVYT